MRVLRSVEGIYSVANCAHSGGLYSNKNIYIEKSKTQLELPTLHNEQSGHLVEMTTLRCTETVRGD